MQFIPVLFPFEEESEDPLSAMGTPALGPINKPQIHFMK